MANVRIIENGPHVLLVIRGEESGIDVEYKMSNEELFQFAASLPNIIRHRCDLMSMSAQELDEILRKGNVL